MANSHQSNGNGKQHSSKPRYTMPLGQYPSPMPYHHRELSEETRFITWESCGRCKETGFIDQARPRCNQCGHTYDAEELASSMNHNWRGRLPCQHPIDQQGMAYVSAQCPDCAGVGWLPGYVTLADVLDFMESVYSTISTAVTARQKAM